MIFFDLILNLDSLFSGEKSTFELRTLYVALRELMFACVKKVFEIIVR